MAAGKELEDWEITRLIYKVANKLQGFQKPDLKDQETIDLIAKLRLEGKLNEQQLKILDEMGQIASMDYDGF